MDETIVKLQGPENFMQWYDFLLARFRPEGKCVYLHKIIHCKDAGSEQLKVIKERVEVYNFILNSINDDFLLGLIAHGLLDQQNEPSKLMALVSKYCECSSETAASLIIKLAGAKIGFFPNVAVFVSFFQLARTCLSTESEIITVLLHNALLEGRPDIYQKHECYCALDWDSIVDDLFALPNDEEQQESEKDEVPWLSENDDGQYDGDYE